MRDRRELYANTIAAWIWSQGTLAASILSLPLLTRFLSGDEFGLWTQLLSLSALATVADMGMSTVFLRRITDSADADPASILQSATVFYRVSSATLTAALLAASLVPGGLLSPYVSHTKMPVLAALLVIVAIGVNLRCQTCTLRLLAQGRMDQELIFGAGPAVVGTLVSIAAAYWFKTAVAVAIGYAAVEIAFDVGLVFIAYRRWPRSRIKPVVGRTLAWWGRLWYESTGVMAIDLVPLVSMAIGIAVVGHVVGPAAAAVYGLGWRVGSLVGRLFTPFSDSLLVSMCRAAASARAALARLANQLSAVILTGGITATFAVVVVGPDGMRLVFGSGYGNVIGVALVFVLTGTIRGMYRPFYRKIQSENGIGSLRYWFAASMIAQVPLTIVATMRWSVVGAAVATLACSAVFEAAPVARKLTMYHRLEGTAGKPVLRQSGAVVCAGCFVVLLAWGRQRLSTATIGFSAIGVIMAGLLTLHQIRRYLAAARPVTNSSPNPGSLTPGLGGKMIVLFQRQLAPYRVSLFNSLNEALDGQFTLVLTRPDPTAHKRLWTVPWPEVRFRTAVLRGHRLDFGRGTWEVSRGVRTTLDGLKPQAVVLGGWDVYACWAALWWARRQGVPLVGCVESSQQSGLRRGIISSTIRRRFLSACSAAIVPGAASEAFVRQLAPAIPCYHALNSVDSPDLRAIGEPPPHGAAVFIGELSERKGVDLVLAAAPHILQLFPRLIIAGDGPMRSDVTALAARLPGMEYAGFVEGPEKTQLFEQAAVVLIPSRRDCGPMVASEALVALRPIVAGPGVGALQDLQRVAGDAVCAMPAATPVDLVDAAKRAQGRAVPHGIRAALGPQAAAASMAAAARFAASAREPVA